MTPATQEKRNQFLKFIERVLLPETAVQAIIGIGSIANGRMRPDSDIDTVLFLDPCDLYIVPAEAYWLAKDNSFHSIFSEDEAIQQGLLLDFVRYDWQQWRDASFEWPEERLSELANGWIAYDRHGDVTRQIQQRSAYPNELRQARLDEAFIRRHEEPGGRGIWRSGMQSGVRDQVHDKFFINRLRKIFWVFRISWG